MTTDRSPAARATELAAGARQGDRRSLARLLTAVENRSPVAEHAMRLLYPRAGSAQLVGITGPPGAGKSTLVAGLISELRGLGRTVAVVAVDPSSPITGGALLGDRVRMQAYAGDDGVFIAQRRAAEFRPVVVGGNPDDRIEVPVQAAPEAPGA